MCVKNILKIGTHSGTFHCDDVLSCVMLTKLYKNVQITRSRNKEVLGDCDIVVDVGEVFDHSQCRYDHHQKSFNLTMNTISNGKYPFDIKLSSCGLVYYFYGRELIKEHRTDYTLSNDQIDLIFKLFYKYFVMPIDGIDNGIQICGCGNQRYNIVTDLSSRVAFCNPPWYEMSEVLDLEQMDSFYKAMDIVRNEYDSIMNYYFNSVLLEFDIVTRGFQQRYELDESGRIMFVERGCPFKNVLPEIERMAGKEGQILFVLSKNAHDHSYRANAVFDGSPFNLRLRLREDLRGLTGNDLFEKSKIEGLRFVHSSGFMGCGDTLDSVLSLAKMSLN